MAISITRTEARRSSTVLCGGIYWSLVSKRIYWVQPDIKEIGFKAAEIDYKIFLKIHLKLNENMSPKHGTMNGNPSACSPATNQHPTDPFAS